MSPTTSPFIPATIKSISEEEIELELNPGFSQRTETEDGEIIEETHLKIPISSLV